jgi:hypothetical protein
MCIVYWRPPIVIDNNTRTFTGVIFFNIFLLIFHFFFSSAPTETACDVEPTTKTVIQTISYALNRSYWSESPSPFGAL